MTCWTIALEKLYHHLFSTPERDSTSIDHLNHDLVLWLSHHRFEELPDALEYYLANPNSDLEVDLTHLNLLGRSMGSAGNHPSYCYHIHLHPPSLGQVFPSHLWGVSRPI